MTVCTLRRYPGPTAALLFHQRSERLLAYDGVQDVFNDALGVGDGHLGELTRRPVLPETLRRSASSSFSTRRSDLALIR